jgi:cell division protein FtsQ
MNARRKPVSNQRRSGSRQRRGQNLLEVTVRSRMVTRQRNRRVLSFVCKLIVLAGIICGGTYGVRKGIQRFILENPEYRLAVVEINDESSGISRETVLTTAGLQLGENIFTVHLEKAREAIAALPQVERVELQRVLPNKVTIEIVERRPVAWVADEHSQDPSASDKSFLIDSKRILFKPKRLLPEYLRLPSIYGVATENFLPGETIDTPELRAALELVQQNGDTSRFQLESIDLSKGYCMVVTDAKRAQITFGIDNVETQLGRLGAVLDYVAGAHREIQTVNLMVERNVPVTFVPAGPEPDVTGSTGAAAQKSEKGTASTTSSTSLSKASTPPVKPAAKATRSDSSRDAFLATRKKSAGVSDSNGESSKKSAAKASPPEPTRRAKKTDEPVLRRAEPVIRRAVPVNLTASTPAAANPY